MDDVHHFAERPYVTADAYVRDDSLVWKVRVIVRTVAMVLASMAVGLVNSVREWLQPRLPKNICGRVALVTGGANGLGRAIAMELARKGCRLAVADVDFDGAQKTCEELGLLGVQAKPYHVDVSDIDQMRNLKTCIEVDLGPVDIVVNNAGIIAGVPIHSGKPEDFKRIIDVNLLSHFYAILTFLDDMEKRGRGHIVAINSILGWLHHGDAVGYCTTKYGLRGLMESFHEELRWRKSPVRLTTAYPNYINTRKEFADKVAHFADDPGVISTLINTPEEVAATIVEGIRKNKRRIFMTSLMSLACTTASAYPSVFQDTVSDFLKPKLDDGA